MLLLRRSHISRTDLQRGSPSSVQTNFAFPPLQRAAAGPAAEFEFRGKPQLTSRPGTLSGARSHLWCLLDLADALHEPRARIFRLKVNRSKLFGLRRNYIDLELD